MLNVWVIPAITTFSEALALSASKVLDIEFSDLKCGYRLRYSQDCIYADVYLYDSLSSGAGYSSRVAELIYAVLDGIEKRLKNCNCDTTCPSCIQHFWNQKVKESLDKESGLKLLEWIRDGKIEPHLPINKQRDYLDILNKIIKLQQGDEYGYEESRDGEFFIKMNGRKRRVIVYPAMCSKNLINSAEDTILIPDRLFKVAIPYVWKLVREQFFK